MNVEQILTAAHEHMNYLLGVMLAFLALYLIYLHRKLSYFMRGENAKSLESTIREYLGHVDELKKHDELIAEHALRLDKKISQAVRNVSMMRFKAFDQSGGNQSFAIALVNELGDGVIISSIHHPNRVSVFAKPVSNYASSHDLSEEEESVLEEAKSSHRS